MAANWRETLPGDHFVQFYRTDQYLIECIAGFAADGLWKDNTVLIVATAAHRLALEERLRLKMVDVSSATATGQYVALDARELLSKFMIGEKIYADGFREVVGHLVRQLIQRQGRLRIYGEMVDLLSLEGNRSAALHLEDLWNELRRQCEFTLYCAYRATSRDDEWEEQIRNVHSCVISSAA